MTASLEKLPVLGCYVFGVMDAGSRLRAPLDVGIASGLRLVEHGDVAALVGEPPADRALGRASDLIDHDRVLADVATSGLAVVPLAFGTVLADDGEVADELLGPRHDELRQLLDLARNRVQYTVTAHYVTEAVLAEVLRADPELERSRRAGDDLQHQLALGERVVDTLYAWRERDGAALTEEVGDVVAVRDHRTAEPTEVLRASFLVDVPAAAAFEDRLEDAARARAGRITIRLVGPSAVYDFVGGR